jgi:hypothetical protein
VSSPLWYSRDQRATRTLSVAFRRRSPPDAAQSSNLRLYFSEIGSYPMRVTNLLTATYYYGFFGFTSEARSRA